MPQPTAVYCEDQCQIPLGMRAGPEGVAIVIGTLQSDQIQILLSSVLVTLNHSCYAVLGLNCP